MQHLVLNIYPYMGAEVGKSAFGWDALLITKQRNVIIVIGILAVFILLIHIVSS